MSRIDKYEPMGGGFRAPLAAAIVANQVGKIYGVSLNSSGRVVIGPVGTSAVSIKGVINPQIPMDIGRIIDVMTDGEMVDVTLNDGTTTIAAGTDVYVNAAAPSDGNLTVTATGNTYIGHTVEGGSATQTRLVVRVAR